jgi:hypothetical protein
MERREQLFSPPQLVLARLCATACQSRHGFSIRYCLVIFAFFVVVVDPDVYFFLNDWKCGFHFHLYPSQPPASRVRALVLTPTRELAYQVAKEFRSLLAPFRSAGVITVPPESSRYAAF